MQINEVVNLGGRFIDIGIAMSAVDQSKEMLRQCRPVLDFNVASTCTITLN